ncbi:ATP-binding protein [Campylobacter corcagiensis]|uniref:ATP-binding protein n=1 Tax=Campylobacter corcagiensis TaxID=1448857 RepID=A0A7M1LGL4_9BACT|nr:DUF87 domain-containing protein [Campylobacter corcagiensis]QKF64097.1 YjgR domain-containing protein [Campylobacter corcagiensis]QOQ87708.1 ATP-binding protein [Campylobacter corcagiensis]
MSIQESLKYFFLGIKQSDEPYLYKNKDLTTHGVIIGMTGSGKTGLGITLIEEASLDNIPSIIIDPKGDMTNLALAFPDMKADDFLPYMDESEAQNKGFSTKELAIKTSSSWKNGIENSFQSLERVKAYKDSADVRIYTPKSSAGLGVSLLSDFIAPVGLNSEDLNSYISAITSSILSLLNVDSENLAAPEVVLLQQIFLENFLANKTVTIADLIHQIATPPFEKIGVFDVETFYPQTKRMALAMKLNSLFASPNFKMWCQGERLDISNMLFDENGKARCNVFTISHLNDDERMFFVTLLLNEIIRWMRTTQGTSSLRAIVYMDEIFGYFPPTSNPPSKTPMLTLLKQARAYGVGLVLSTQNPVDLDYKGLSNIGTWFIGRLQTAQDKERVISGLTGISGSAMQKDEILKLLSNLEKRKFLVKNINEDGLEVIGTRFALSYLKGPLSSEQISDLMVDKKKSIKTNVTTDISGLKPVISSDISEVYSYTGDLNLSPYLLGTAKVKFSHNDLVVEKDINLLYPLAGVNEVNWSDAEKTDVAFSSIKKDDSKYINPPSFITSSRNFNEFEKSLKEYIFRNVKLKLFTALGITSNFGEEKSEFLLRLHDKCNEILEAKTDKVEEKFKKEKLKLEDKLKKAQVRVDRETADVKSRGLDAVINIGSAILGAFLGSKTVSKTNMGKVATSAKSAGRVLDARKDVEFAKEALYSVEAEIEDLVAKNQKELEELKEIYNIKNLEIKTKEISAKKSDIFNEKVYLLWKS